MVASATLNQDIVAAAQRLGFGAVGFCRPDSIALAGGRLQTFLDLGRHGDMDWLQAKADRRRDPLTLWPAARAVIMLAEDYAPGRDPLAILEQSDRGAISVYAQGSDYHDVVKRRLKALGRWLADTTGAELKVFVDTAPVMEKPLAAAAGIGWQGKHTNLVSRRLGSWSFLGAIFTTLDLAPDAPESDHCGDCRRCLDVCPTAAFPAPYQLDARRCISYLTIEHAGPIDRDLRPLLGNRIYGCDDCLAVCPWNKFAQSAHQSRAYLPRAELLQPRLTDLVGLDEAGFRRLFAGSPIKRTGRARFLRNVLIALGNGGDRTAVPAILPLLGDPAPLIRGAAVWALSRLLPPAELSALRSADDPDPQVTDEWQAALIRHRPR